MDFGVVVPNQFAPTRDPGESLRETRRFARLAERLGYESLWVTEHHFTAEMCYFDPFQLLAHLAADTDAVRLGTAVCLVPLYNPVRLAERVANADVLADGRFTFGVGVGYRSQEFEVLGVDRSRRGQRTTEALEILTAVWRDGSVTYHGTEFQFENVAVSPTPLQENGPPVWVGGRAPAAVRRAAKIGDAWLVPSSLGIDDIAEPNEVYEATCKPDSPPDERPIFREVFVAETTEQAIGRARPYLAEKYETYATWREEEDWLDVDGGNLFEQLAGDLFLVGSPEDVIEQAARYRDQYGLSTILSRSHWAGMPTAHAEQSLRLLAEEVVPHLRE